MPRWMASIFRASPSSERPAPRPVITSMGWPSSTAATALDVVVLPMPISPVASRPTPAFFCSCTSRMPLPMASTASALLMAGPRVSPLCRGDAAVEDARDRFARDAHIHRHHLAPGGLGHPADAGAAGGEVLGHGAGHALSVWLTPWATTPLSAQSTSTARRKYPALRCR